MFCVVSSPNINTIYFKILYINNLNMYDNIKANVYSNAVINTCRVSEFNEQNIYL